jgi:hypothetical protein
VRSSGNEGLGSAELKQKLSAAIAGKPNELAFWLARFGGMPSTRPNLALASGFGAEAAAHGDKALRVLSLLAASDAAPDTAEVFLPIAASYGYAALIRRKTAVRPAWEALFALAADERPSVQRATAAALTQLAASTSPDALIAEVDGWIGHEDRDLRWGSLRVAVTVLAERHAMEAIGDREGWLDRLTRILTDLADAPRAAERSEARRRLLEALPPAIALVASSFRASPNGVEWLLAECERATQVDVRAALSSSIDLLRKRGASEKVEVLESLRASLASSAKPDRHAARRKEGTNRGKKEQTRGG